MHQALPFRYRLRVRYNECDAQRVVFNARYADYVDLAMLEFIRALGLRATFVTGPLDYQVVKQTLEWRAPAHFDEVIEIRMEAAGLGNTSFTCVAEMRRVGEETLLARAETVYVLVSADTLAKTPLTAELRARFAAGAPGRTIDHAGGAEPA